MSKQTIDTLVLQFDAKQFTQVLLYEFIDSSDPDALENLKPTITRVGPFTGCYRFKADTQLHVDLTMTNLTTENLGRVLNYNGEEIDIISIDGFEVNSLDLVSQPNVRDAIMPLSPFNRELATINLPKADWTKPEAVVGSQIQMFKSELKDGKLSTGPGKGFWKVSGFLSVNILLTIKGGEQLAIPRTFSFDPEMEGGEL